jgi:FixJ family two-component response regulator
MLELIRASVPAPTHDSQGGSFRRIKAVDTIIESGSPARLSMLINPGTKCKSQNTRIYEWMVDMPYVLHEPDCNHESSHCRQPNIVANKTIAVIDDDPDVLHAFAIIFHTQGYEVASFDDAESFVSRARQLSPACVLLDLYMPGKSGLEMLKEIDARSYPAPIIVMSGRGDVATAVAAIKNGADDFIEKRLGIEPVATRVREAIDNWVGQPKRNSPGHASQSSSVLAHEGLSSRENEVLREIVAGATSKQAARALGLSPRTIEGHRVNIRQKLGAKNLIDLVRIAVRNEPTER